MTSMTTTLLSVKTSTPNINTLPCAAVLHETSPSLATPAPTSRDSSEGRAPSSVPLTGAAVPSTLPSAGTSGRSSAAPADGAAPRAPPAIAPKKIPMAGLSQTRRLPPPAALPAAAKSLLAGKRALNCDAPAEMSRQPPRRQPSAEAPVAAALPSTRGDHQPRRPFAERVGDVFATAFAAHEGGIAASGTPRADVASVAKAVAAAIETFAPRPGEQARTVAAALQDAENDALRAALLNGTVSPKEVALMSALDLASPQHRARVAAEREARSRGRNAQAILADEATRTELYPCPVCASRTCVMAVKSSAKGWFTGGEDGVLDIIVTCLECNKSFKP